MKRNRIAVFASGNGTNAEEIFKYFRNHKYIKVCGVLTNNPAANVINRAANHQLPCHIFDRKTFSDKEKMQSILNEWEVDAVVLAGFLWLIPGYLIKQYPERIINIHPALLPRFGGKGMYGMRVHQAVIDSGEKESGITIHQVNEEYDKGKIIFQAKCAVTPQDTAETLAGKIHDLEHRFYPKIIEQWLMQ
ncbi:MAG: phosphoribosylglycinamide formyltransferase [Cyclobacteriaceae bacterium]|nr:MAG: phosphoribosylglycinamide formyltransferase [Cyclobacteriaceae bacterium]